MDTIEYIGRLPRAVAIATGLRQISPRPDRIPSHSVEVEEIDTGGAFRADWRMQDPAVDPKEPNGGESSSVGNEHGWANCTMCSAALAYSYQVQDKSGPYPGEFRHKQSDLSGGTDLYDARDAWKAYGNQTLTIKTGAGWGAVQTAHKEGRAVIIQGEGNVPGSESFDGGHACVIAPETHSDGRWLFGDPLATGWQWVSESSIKTWAQNLSSSIYFAVSKIPAASTPPPPAPEPCPVTVGEVDIKYMEASAVAAERELLLSQMVDWVANPVDPAPFPLGDALALVPNLGWNEGKWNQTTWYLRPIDPNAARWDSAIWAGTSPVEGGTWG